MLSHTRLQHRKAMKAVHAISIKPVAKGESVDAKSIVKIIFLICCKEGSNLICHNFAVIHLPGNQKYIDFNSSYLIVLNHRDSNSQVSSNPSQLSMENIDLPLSSQWLLLSLYYCPFREKMSNHSLMIKFNVLWGDVFLVDFWVIIHFHLFACEAQEGDGRCFNSYQNNRER